MTDRSAGRDDMKAGVPTEWGDERRGWHFDKTIGADTIIAVVGLLVGAVLWSSGVERRIAEQSARIAEIEKQRIEDRQLQARDREELRTDMKEFSAKVDRLLERVTGRQ